MAQYLCPTCEVPFSITPDGIACASCGFGGRVIDGVLCFVNPEGCECGNSREEIARINCLTQEVGWQAAIKQVLPEKAGWIGDEHQADFKNVWELPPDANILDIGDNWGTVAAVLGKTFAQVTVVNKFLEHARLIALRMRELRLPVETICADYRRMLLAPGQFDAVVLSETLHTGIPDGRGNAREVQLLLLKAARAVLKPSGFICVGVENRFGWHRLRRFHGRGHPRASVHSLAGYRALLREAGYEQVRAYHSWNGYDSPSFLLPLENRAALEHFAGLYNCSRPKYWALWLAARTGLWQRLAPEVIFVAAKG